MNQVRLGLAVAGFIVVLAGVVREDGRLVWAAIALLVASFSIRMYLRSRRPAENSPGDPGDSTDPPDSQ